MGFNNYPWEKTTIKKQSFRAGPRLLSHRFFPPKPRPRFATGMPTARRLQRPSKTTLEKGNIMMLIIYVQPSPNGLQQK